MGSPDLLDEKFSCDQFLSRRCVLLVFVIAYFLQGCLEGEKPTPLPRAGHQSPPPKEKSGPELPAPDKN